MKKNGLLWIAAVVFTLSSAFYQRLTGPTHPVTGTTVLAGQPVSYRLIRSFAGGTDAPVRIQVTDPQVSGMMRYRRTPSNDGWGEAPLVREQDYLVAYIPQQPPAGKVQYQITLENDDQQLALTAEPIVIRFRGDVPAWAMIPHILFMFLAMLLSTRTGMAALFHEKTSRLTTWTVVSLLLGGLLLGPIVQKFAFDAYWTGWPFGTDLTDNKTAAAFLFWGIAFIKTRRNPNHRAWVLAASVILLLVYLIPHSAMGSEIDFTQQTTTLP